MKNQIFNIVFFSLLLTIILIFYFLSSISFISLKSTGFIIAILLVLYFLFINVTLHYIDLKDNLKLKRFKLKRFNSNIPSLKKSILIFFGILIFISVLTYLITKFVQIVPSFNDKEYNYLIIMGLLLFIFFQEARKHSTSTK
jgi:hypothetical protein